MVKIEGKPISIMDPMAMRPTRPLSKSLDIEGKSVSYTFHIDDVHFNQLGSYQLKLSVQNSAREEFSQAIKIREDAKERTDGSEVLLDILKQSSLSEPLTVGKSVTFFMPIGYCKNDIAHDVYLLVEAFSVLDLSNGKVMRVGEAKVAIYPRTDTPRANLAAPPGEPMYNYSEVMTLLRTLSAEPIQMHCGRLRYKASLEEYINDTKPSEKGLALTPISEPQNVTPLPSPRNSIIQKPSKSPLNDTPSIPQLPVLPPISQPLPPLSLPPPLQASSPRVVSPNVPASFPSSPIEGLRNEAATVGLNERSSSAPIFVTELNSPSPPGTRESPRRMAVADGKFVLPKKVQIPGLVGLMESLNDREKLCWPQTATARGGTEELIVVVHAVYDIPRSPSGHLPKPGIVLTTSSVGSVSVSGSSRQPSCQLVMEELLSVEIMAATANSQEILLAVVDTKSQSVLMEYCWPWAYLQPFHHYHLELVQSYGYNESMARLVVTMLRRSHTMPVDPASPNYSALQVVLCGMDSPLRASPAPMVAVAKIAGDYALRGGQSGLSTSLQMTTVQFPGPHPAAFTVGHPPPSAQPQVSLPGRPLEQPQWNHLFTFCANRDRHTLFTPGAALVITLHTLPTAALWELDKPAGRCVLHLDEHVYTQLASTKGSLGLRVPNIPIQDTLLISRNNSTPTISLYLRLLPIKDDDDLLSTSDPNLLPELDHNYPAPSLPIANPTSSSWLLQPRNTPYRDDQDTLSNTLSNPELFYVGSINSPVTPLRDDELPSHNAVEHALPESQKPPPLDDGYDGPPLPPHPYRAPDKGKKDLDSQQVHVMDHQLKELENYRLAVHKMGQDILALRQQVRHLEASNSRLRRELLHYNDSTRLLLDSMELDGLSKNEVASRYVALKQKLTSQTAELTDYRDKVLILQTELLTRGKDGAGVRGKSHQSQQQMAQKLQDKAQRISKLEGAIRKQESVIEKMEKLLNKKTKESDRTVKDKANEALMEENRRLRQNIQDLEEQEVGHDDGQEELEREKLDLLESLDKAEGRIMSLEQQLSENARQWGREKSELLLQLRENDTGRAKTQSASLNNYPFLGHRSRLPSPEEGPSRRYTKGYRHWNSSQKLEPLKYK